MNLEEAHTIADALERTVFPANQRPAQEGDFLYIEVARDRTPINMQEWVHGYWEEAPAMERLTQVIGDYDVPRTDSRTRRAIRPMWGKTFIASIVGAEFITYSTDGAYLFSRHQKPEDSEKRVLACLAEACDLYSGSGSVRKPSEGLQERAYELGRCFYQRCSEGLREALRRRYRDAPLLLGWPAPEFENTLARAIIMCALDGGKKAGEPRLNLPESVEVPSWQL